MVWVFPLQVCLSQVAAGALAGQSRTLDYLGVDFLMAPSLGAGAGN